MQLFIIGELVIESVTIFSLCYAVNGLYRHSNVCLYALYACIVETYAAPFTVIF